MIVATRRLALAGIVAAGALAALPAGAEKPDIFAPDGIAVRGYDVVAYFTLGKPTPGKAEFSHAWKGATWRFANAAHRDAFKAEPAKYAPQYGGYCAYGVSQGVAVPVDPTAWRIVEGKLYLNFNASVQTKWAQDIPGYVGTADKNWPAVLKK
jgi:YHS domain-containing protein